MFNTFDLGLDSDSLIVTVHLGNTIVDQKILNMPVPFLKQQLQQMIMQAAQDTQPIKITAQLLSTEETLQFSNNTYLGAFPDEDLEN